MQKILFDYGKLRNDVEKANNNFKDGKSMCARLNEYGLGQYVFGNANATFKRHSEQGKIDMSEYENCEQYGLLAPYRLKNLCECFQLDMEDYKVKKLEKKEACADNKQEKQREEVGDCDRDEKVIEKIDELIMTINKLGNIQMQNMEYLKIIKDGIQEMNEKWK